MKKILAFLLISLLPLQVFGAIAAGTVWEIRQDSTANGVNGGGFYDRDPGTSVDYSQQTTAELTLTDLATDGAGTGLSSVTGGFTAAMAGNVIHITVTGTGLTLGWYEITAYTDTNNVTIDRTAGASKTGGTGYVGGAFSLNSTLDDDFYEQLVPGNIVYMKYNASAFAFGEAMWIAKDGTTALPIVIEGYHTTRGDNPVGANRPTIAGGATTWGWDNYVYIKNLILTGTSNFVLDYDAGCLIENCKVTNSSESADRYAIYQGDGYSRIVDCELISTLGRAVFLGNNSHIHNTYIHDSAIGIYLYTQFQTSIEGNVIDTCTTGTHSTTGYNNVIKGNTFYGCTTGITGTTGYCNLVLNNIFDNNTTGVNWTSELKSNQWDYNCWDNGTDTVNVTKGDNSVTGDPGLTDPANGDFTLGSGSNCLDAGIQMGTDQGTVGDCTVNIGVDQDDVTAAGGGGGRGACWSIQ